MLSSPNAIRALLYKRSISRSAARSMRSMRVHIRLPFPSLISHQPAPSVIWYSVSNMYRASVIALLLGAASRSWAALPIPNITPFLVDGALDS